MKKYDVLVAGGGTAGCACAYTAAKLGLKVLLIEQSSFLGGSITSSLVVPAMKTSDNAINTDFYNELYKNLRKINGAITYCDGNSGWFNPELTKIVLDKMLKDVSVDIMFEAHAENIEENISSYIVTIYDNFPDLSANELSLHIETRYIVDATGDAKICEKLNCEFLNFSSESEKKFQPVNLRFIMSGVNVKQFTKWIMDFDRNRDVTTSCTVDGNT